MELAIKYVDSDRGLIMTFSGAASAESIAEALIQDVFSDPRFGGIQYTVSDFEKAEIVEMDFSHMEKVVSTVRKSLQVNDHRIGAIAGSTDKTFGFSRMFELQRGDLENYRAFRNMDEAKAWVSREMKKRHGFDPTFS